MRTFKTVTKTTILILTIKIYIHNLSIQSNNNLIINRYNW